MGALEKVFKTIGKAASSLGKTGAKNAIPYVKAPGGIAKLSKAEINVAKEGKAARAIKSIGNPDCKVKGVIQPRFIYNKGVFIDVKRGSRYTIKDFSRLRTHYRNLYGSGAKNSYLSWEKGLKAKTSFMPKFNFSIPKAAKVEAKATQQAAKGATKAAEQAGQKATQQAAKSASKVAEEAKTVGEEAAEKVAKQRWYQNPENWKGVYREGKSGAKFAVKNSLAISQTALLGYIGWNILTGRGLIHPALDAVKGNTDKSFAEDLLDASFGEGSYNYIKGGLGGTVGEGVDLYYRLKDGVTGVGNEVVDLYRGGKEMMAGAFTGNGMVSDGSGNYYDPTAEQYPGMDQMTGMQQSNGMMSSLMGGMSNAVNSISGGNVSKMNLAGLLLSAYMMFGRFGWLGKAASLMLGGMTLKNINNHQGMQQQTQRQQQQVQSIVQQPSYQTVELPATEDDVVVRSRHM